MKLEEKVKELKTKAAEMIIDKGLELVIKPAKEMIQDIEECLNSPVDETVNAFGELTTGQQLLNVARKYGKEAGYNMLKKAENMGIAALTLIPALGTVSQDLVEAAILEGASPIQAKALAMGAQVTSKGEVAYPLTHLIGEKAAVKVATVLKAIDPFTDIDPRIVTACGVAGVFIPGVGAIPAGIEIAILNMKDIKNEVRAAGEFGSILSKSPELQSIRNFSKSVIESVTNHVQRAVSPQMVQARAAFGI